MEKMDYGKSIEGGAQGIERQPRGKELSIYGFPMKAAYLGTVLIPHRLIMELMTAAGGQS